MKVTYLHRTVKGCLDKWEMLALLKNWTGGNATNAYNPNLAILKSCILQLKTIRDDRHDFLSWSECMDAVLLYGHRVEADTTNTQTELMDVFFNIAPRWIRHNISTEPVFRPDSSPSTTAVQCGLYRYLRAKLKIDNVIRADHVLMRRRLVYALIPRIGLEQFVSVHVVKVLLEFGAKPEYSWAGAIDNLDRVFGESSRKTVLAHDREYILKQWESIIELLVQAGVDFTPHAEYVLKTVLPPHQYIDLWNNLHSILRSRKTPSRRSRVIGKQSCRQQ
jgi:hypothetical protein